MDTVREGKRKHPGNPIVSPDRLTCVDGFRNARFFGERRGESPLRVVNSGLEDGGMPEGCEVGSESQGVTG